MQRSLRILSHGWQEKAISVLTLGHYPAISIVGKLCIGTITMSTPGATLAFALPSMAAAMTLPAMAAAMTLPAMSAGMSVPGMEIEIEDCD